MRAAALVVLFTMGGFGCAPGEHGPGGDPAVGAGSRLPPAVDPAATVASLDPSLVPVRHPALDTIGEDIARQLTGQRSLVDRLQADPGTTAGELARAFGLMGQLYHVYGMRGPAEDCYLNAATLAPHEFAWPYYLARLRATQGKLEAAIEAYERALAIDPGYMPARVWMGRACRDLGRPDRARALFESALARGKSSAAAMFELGQLALSADDPERALEWFERALEEQPQAAVVHYALGMAHRALGNREAAERHLSQSAPGMINPTDPLMTELRALGSQLNTVGALAFRLGRYDLAEQEFRKIVEARPGDTDARVNLGMALARLDRLGEATKQLRQALRLAPDHAEAHLQLGIVLARRKRFEEAAGEFTAALDADPSHLTARFNLASMLARLGRHAKAADEYARVIEDDAGNVNAHVELAIALGRTGRYRESLTVLEDARGAMRDEGTIATALARLLAACPLDRVRDGARALELAREAIDGEGTGLGNVQALAMAHAELGDFANAVHEQERARDAARDAGRVDLLPVLEENLERYRRREPCRLPWADGPTE